MKGEPPRGSNETARIERVIARLGRAWEPPRSLLVSSWTTASLYRIEEDGSIRTVATELKSPADIAYDAKRQKVLVPQMMLDRLLVTSVTSGAP